MTWRRRRPVQGDVGLLASISAEISSNPDGIPVELDHDLIWVEAFLRCLLFHLEQEGVVLEFDEVIRMEKLANLVDFQIIETVVKDQLEEGMTAIETILNILC